jgi:hypothetical protein
MACFKPLEAYRQDDGEIVFKDTGGSPLLLPCGQCIGCRLDRSRDWALRCVHEAQLHDDNCFITLTYSPENLPPDGGLVKSDFQKFMKRLRKKYDGKRIRYYMCGEYGDRNNRPHYHAILFGMNFDDWTFLFNSPGGEPIYTSPELEKIWGLGYVTIGKVTFESAAYVSRYIMKKINGAKADEIDPETDLKHYQRIDIYGEIKDVHPEYNAMSRRPGIASDWIKRFTGDVYPKDYTTIRGVRHTPPRYYDKYLESIDEEMYDDIKQGRMITAYELAKDNTPERRKQKEIVKIAQHGQLKRQI